MRYTAVLFTTILLLSALHGWLQPAMSQPTITGTWKVIFEGRNLQATLVLEQQDKNIEGTWTIDGSPSQSLEGTIIGDSLRLTGQQRERNGKLLISTHAGKVKGDVIEGKLSFRWKNDSQIGGTRSWSAIRINTTAFSDSRKVEKQKLSIIDISENQLKDRFQAELDRIRNKEKFPGAIAAFLLDDGRSAVVATGQADQEHNISMTPNDRMLAGSIGKTFVAAVALDLVHECKLDLDTFISTWLGNEPWFDRLPNAKDITLRMLLNHSGGLIDHVKDSRYAAAIQEKAENVSLNRDFVFSPRELVEFTLDQEPLFPAGKGYSYTDTGYILVGIIIEQVTGSVYYDQVQERFLDPLSLTQTSPANRRTLSGLVPGYMASDNPLGLPEKTVENGEMAFNPATEWTGGGLVSNPKDLVRWAKALYEDKAMDKPYLRDLLDLTRKGHQGDTRYGYGLGVSISESDLGTIYGHDGWFPGYRSKVAYFPEYKMAVGIQVNTDVQVDLGSYVSQLACILLTNTYK